MSEPQAIRRVLIVNCTDGYGGGEFYGRDFARALQLRGVDTLTFIAGSGTNLRDDLLDKGVKAVSSGIKIRMSRPWSVIRNALRLRRLVRRVEPDVIVANLPRSVLLCVLVDPLRVRLVTLLHSPLGPGLITRVAAHLSKRILTNTEANADQLRIRMPSRKIAVVYPTVILEEADVRGRRNYVTMVGRFQKYKGHLDFIRVARAVADKYPLVRFAVFGSVLGGEQETHLEAVKAEIAAQGLSDKFVIGVGESGERISDALRSSLVYVHPSLFEDFGISVVEALAHGALVAAYDAAGPRLILDGVKSAALVPTGEVDALANATLDLLTIATSDANERASDVSRSAAGKWIMGEQYAEGCVRALSELMDNDRERL